MVKKLRILRKINDTLKEKGNFVGFHMDPEIDTKLTLWASSKKISKSALIRDILKDWIRGKDVVEAVARQALVVYEFEGKQKVSSDEFKFKLKHELIHKGVGRQMIQSILEHFDIMVDVRKSL